MDPWWFRMTSRQRYKPTPAASAVGFVVKNSLYALLKKLQKKDFTPIINIHVEKRLNGTIFLCIRDNGIGIEDNIKAKIFEPFFTTKPTAEAAGVGLYLCREVILTTKGPSS